MCFCSALFIFDATKYTDEFFIRLSLFSRNKSARTITYSQFKEALAELARKRCKDKSSEDAAQELYTLIEGKSPVISGVTVKPTADVLLFL